MKRAAWALAALILSFPTSARAASEDAEPSSAESAARDATTPFPTKLQLKFKPAYTFPRGETRERAQLQFEALVPYKGVLIPDLVVDDITSLTRVQITGASVQNHLGTASGLEDLNFVDLAVRRFGPLYVGPGFGSVFPLATSPLLGNGKWQLGPALGLRLDTVEALHLAVLTQALWSVAGSSQLPDVASLSVQPFFAVHLPAALNISTDAMMRFFWDGGRTSVPVNLGLGHAFSHLFVGTLKWQVTVAGVDRGAQRGEVTLTFRP